MKQKGKIWLDHKGTEIPIHAVNPVQKAEEKHAHRIAKQAIRVEKSLIQLKKLINEGYSDVLEKKISRANYLKNKVPTLQSGMTINSFDGLVEVRITKPDTLYFDKTFTEIVKTKFDEYFKSFGNDNEQVVFLRNLVNELLFTNSGRLDISKVMSIRKQANNIKNSKKISQSSQHFVDAVDLFDQAIKTKAGNTGIYINVAEKQHEHKRKVAIKITDI